MSDNLNDEFSNDLNNILDNEFEEINISSNESIYSHAITGDGDVLLSAHSCPHNQFLSSNEKNYSYEETELFQLSPQNLNSGQSSDSSAILSTHLNESHNENDVGKSGAEECHQMCLTTPMLDTNQTEMSIAGTSTDSSNNKPLTSEPRRSRGRPPKNRTKEEQIEATRQTNKKAAKAYRDRKKLSSNVSQKKEDQMMAINQQLRQKIASLDSEIRISKQLLRQLFNANEESLEKFLKAFVKNRNSLR